MNADELSRGQLEELDVDLVELGQLLHQGDEELRQALLGLEEDDRALYRVKAMMEDRRGEVDIFDELGLHGNELFHSKMLAWLLNPRGSHGLGDRFLQEFLKLFHGRPPISAADRPATSVAREVHLNYEGESGRLDILIRNSRANYVCAIENKVWSPEGENQLAWYRKVLGRDYADYRVDLVFLTREGLSPEDDQEHPHWITMSYSKILQLVEGFLDSESNTENRDVRAVLNQYAVTLRRNIVPDVSNDIHELAKRIYRKHRRAIDLIMENVDQYRPDYVGEGYRMIQEAIRQHPLWNLGRCDRPYVRFRSADWVAYEELSLDGWPFFLLLFEVRVTYNGVSLYLSLCQGGDDSLRRRIYDRVRERGDLFNGAASAYSDQYLKLHEEGDILEESEYEDWWDEEGIRDRIGSRLDAFAPGDVSQDKRGHPECP